VRRDERLQLGDLIEGVDADRVDSNGRQKVDEQVFRRLKQRIGVWNKNGQGVEKRLNEG
jgi:hypothetical protein